MNDDPCVLYISSCKLVSKCANNHCMFRLRDVFGHTVFAPWGKSEIGDHNHQACIRAGVGSDEDQAKIGWPTMTGRPGTNVVGFYCDWYKELENPK